MPGQCCKKLGIFVALQEIINSLLSLQRGVVPQGKKFAPVSAPQEFWQLEPRFAVSADEFRQYCQDLGNSAEFQQPGPQNSAPAAKILRVWIPTTAKCFTVYHVLSSK